jgi:hypothetical protein
LELIPQVREVDIAVKRFLISSKSKYPCFNRGKTTWKRSFRDEHLTQIVLTEIFGPFVAARLCSWLICRRTLDSFAVALGSTLDEGASWGDSPQKLFDSSIVIGSDTGGGTIDANGISGNISGTGTCAGGIVIGWVVGDWSVAVFCNKRLIPAVVIGRVAVGVGSKVKAVGS